MPPATRRSPRLAEAQHQQQQEQQEQQHQTTTTTRRRASSAGARRAGGSMDPQQQLPQSSSSATAPRRVFLLSGYELSTFALIVAYCLVVLFREGDRLCRAVLRELPPADLSRAGLAAVPAGSWERFLFRSPANDLSDAQWRDFRGSAPLLAAVLGGFVLVSRLARAWDERQEGTAVAATGGPPLRLGLRTPLLALLGALFLVVLHGAAAIFPIGLSLASYWVAHRCAGRPRGLWAVWAWHVAVFFAVRVSDGFFGLAGGGGGRENALGPLGAILAWIYARRGPLRWHIHYNLLLLRMVSHAADLHWARLAEAAGAAAAGAAGAGAAARAAAKGAVVAAAAAAGASSDAGVAVPAAVAPSLSAPSAAVATASAAVAAGLPLTRRRRRALERGAAERHLPPPAYSSPCLYLAYCLYPPLYIAGPIATFNALGAQILPAQPPRAAGAVSLPAGAGASKAAAADSDADAGETATTTTAAAAPFPLSPLPRPTAREVALYALRAAACWLVLEGVTHRLFFWTVARNGLWRQLARSRASAAAGGAVDPGHLPPSASFLPPLQMALVPWWVMLFAWLKFLALWRFFRLFALADGSSAAPENLTRCICNNYDVAGFWQNWHASYNRWLVRYMYVPMGGSRSRILNVWPIFTFVAIWHDLEIKMLAWAWLMALLVAPEALAKWVGARPRWPFPDKTARSFRYACAAAGAANVVLLMAANMVGFVFGGLEGAGTFLRRVVAEPSFGPVVAGAFFCGVQLMFALRDWEGWREGREREEEAGLFVGRVGGGGGSGGALSLAALGGGGGGGAGGASGAGGAARRRGGGAGIEEGNHQPDEVRVLLAKSGGGGV